MNKLKMWLALRLGSYYAATVQAIDRSVVVFGSVFVVRGLAGLFGYKPFDLVGWSAVLVLALVALLIVWALALLMIMWTGSPALLSPFSRTLRSTRIIAARPMHHVPIRRDRLGRFVGERGPERIHMRGGYGGLGVLPTNGPPTGGGAGANVHTADHR